MPCYQQNKITVDLRLADSSLLATAILKHVINASVNLSKYIEFSLDGRLVLVDLKNGTVTADSYITVNKATNLIKQLYSKEAIELAAKKYGFTVSKVDDDIILRRY